MSHLICPSFLEPFFCSLPAPPGRLVERIPFSLQCLFQLLLPLCLSFEFSVHVLNNSGNSGQPDLGPLSIIPSFEPQFQFFNCLFVPNRLHVPPVDSQPLKY